LLSPTTASGRRVSIEWPPLIGAVAPNGARKTKDDHPALPITADEIAATAAACRDGRHTLDAGAYRTATAAVRSAVGDSLIVQVTSEAAGRYAPAQQMAMVRAVRPEEVSLALRELAATGAQEADYAAFLSWAHAEGILAQHILYSPGEVRRFQTLRRRGLIPQERPSVLFVLGRTGETLPRPADIVPYLQAIEPKDLAGLHWAVCVFGANEGACAAAAIALDGDVRVGFENNLHLPDGAIASDNTALAQRRGRGRGAEPSPRGCRRSPAHFAMRLAPRAGSNKNGARKRRSGR
jgi:uncharacterized protein (DUF849 family)